jgi:hypothetical protein
MRFEGVARNNAAFLEVAALGGVRALLVEATSAAAETLGTAACPAAGKPADGNAIEDIEAGGDAMPDAFAWRLDDTSTPVTAAFTEALPSAVGGDDTAMFGGGVPDAVRANTD